MILKRPLVERPAKQGLSAEGSCVQFAGENALRESGASYTVVRPGGLNNGQAGQHKLVTGQHKHPPPTVYNLPMPKPNLTSALAT